MTDHADHPAYSQPRPVVAEPAGAPAGGAAGAVSAEPADAAAERTGVSTAGPSRSRLREVRVLAVTGLGEISPGAPVASLLAEAMAPLGPRDGDVVCISTKIISKAHGLQVPAEQREAAVEQSSVRTVARRRHTRVVTTVAQIPSGPVMAAAGVDTSNAPGGPLLLPEDPDACARELREQLQALLGVRCGVLLTDTSSRIWRVGVGDIALGAAGIASLQDLRGSTDADGRTLAVTVRNLADELAAAADLVKGKAHGIPAAIVRGLPGAVVEGPGVPATALSRTGEEDWFRRPSLESVWQALGLTLDQEPIARMSPEPADQRITRAIEVALIPRPTAAGAGPATTDARPASRDATAALSPPAATARLVDPDRIEVTPVADSPAHWMAAGALAERIRTALGAEEIAAPLPPVHLEITPPPPHPDEEPR